MTGKKYIRLLFIPVLFICGIGMLQAGVRWEEVFTTGQVPDGWLVVDNDGSGSLLQLVPNLVLQTGHTVNPEAGGYFWSAGYSNANLAGVIDEWLISPQFSVIYAGDSLHFHAGAVDGPFKDSLRVLVSTTDSRISSFTHQLGYFKVEGPPGSWHRYSFNLSKFDSTDIYFAVNYTIKNGGSGGLNSDHVWIDHFMITGEVAELNTPPSGFHLLTPANYRLLHPVADTTLHFSWSASHDTDHDPLRYTLKILDVFPEMKFENIPDTCLDFNWQDRLNPYAAYRWTVGVTDGKSRIASPDTFLFITPPLDNLEPFAFDLIYPRAGDTVFMSDTVLFIWHPALDANSDTLVYDLRIFGSGIDKRFTDIADTSCLLWCPDYMQSGQSYSWEVYARDKEYETRSRQSWLFETEDVSELHVNEITAPRSPVLFRNYPNPFNSGTVIRYRVETHGYASSQPVELTIYNIMGQKIQTLVAEDQREGEYSVHWDAAEYPSGIYYGLLTIGNQGLYYWTITRKMILIK